MVLLTLNKKDLWMREAMLREVKWFVQKVGWGGGGELSLRLMTLQGLGFHLYVDIHVRVHPSRGFSSVSV